MNNKLIEVSRLQREKGITYSDEIEAVLFENDLEIQEKSPVHMLFSFRNKRFCSRGFAGGERFCSRGFAGGEIIWNSIDDSISVIYSFRLFSGDDGSYSRVLHWYIQKRLKKPEILPKGVSLCVIYPGTADWELKLRLDCKVTFRTLRKKTGMLLFLLDDIVENEYKTVDAILTGDIPDNIRTELLTEIRLTLSELDEKCPEVIQNGENTGI